MFSSNLKLFVLLLGFNCFSNVHGTYHYDCEDTPTLGEIKSVKVSNCDSDEENSKCLLKRGTNVTFDLTFVPGAASDKIKAVVHGILFIGTKVFNLPNDNGCVNSGITCPVTKDGRYTYRTNLPVKKLYPKVSVEVKWELQNGEGKDLVCVMIPAKLH